jgi:hypothetical protein
LQKDKPSPTLKALGKREETNYGALIRVLKDLKTWWKTAPDRNLWGRIIKQPKVHHT